MKPIKPLGIKAQKIEGIWGKVRGLIFSKRKSLLFIFNREQKIGIHMLFVLFKIIVVWLDSNKRITKVKVMRPFISFSEAKGKYVLEIPYSEKVMRRLKNLSYLRWI